MSHQYEPSLTFGVTPSVPHSIHSCIAAKSCTPINNHAFVVIETVGRTICNRQRGNEGRENKYEVHAHMQAYRMHNSTTAQQHTCTPAHMATWPRWHIKCTHGHVQACGTAQQAHTQTHHACKPPSPSSNLSN